MTALSMDRLEAARKAISEMRFSDPYSVGVHPLTMEFFLGRVARTSNTLTEWCNARLEYGLPAFTQGWWKHD